MKAKVSETLGYILMTNQSAVNQVQKAVIKNVDIKNCHACGKEHQNLSVTALENPIEWYNFYSTCPFTNKPIYIKFVTE